VILAVQVVALLRSLRRWTGQVILKIFVQTTRAGTCRKSGSRLTWKFVALLITKKSFLKHH